MALRLTRDRVRLLRLVGGVLVVAGFGVAFILVGGGATSGQSNPTPSGVNPATSAPSVIVPTGRLNVADGNVAVGVQFTSSDPLQQSLAPGDHIDIFVEGNGYIIRDLLILRVTSSGVGTQQKASALIVQVPSDAGPGLVAATAHPQGNIHYALRASAGGH